MKKILSLMLVAIMLISLFACGKQNENTSGTTESTASDTTSDRTAPEVTTSASETTTKQQHRRDGNTRKCLMRKSHITNCF